jgi:AraC-like DNA-binding protein
MKWVRIAFFSALAVGIISMVANFFPKHYDWIITLSFAIFYFGFAQEYIKYNKIFNLIEPAILVETTESTPLQPPVRTKADWKFYKQQIVTQRYYCEIGTNIEEMASKLNIGRTTLSTYINREEGVNFNTWINMLRIEDAKQILIDNPDYSIAIISEMVGYTEQANFSRQFKLITGESPLVWRKKSAAS